MTINLENTAENAFILPGDFWDFLPEFPSVSIVDGVRDGPGMVIEHLTEANQLRVRTERFDSEGQVIYHTSIYREKPQRSELPFSNMPRPSFRAALHTHAAVYKRLNELGY